MVEWRPQQGCDIGDPSAHSTGYCGGVEARYTSARRPAVAKAEMTGDVESDELTERQGVGWIYLLDVARSISF